MAHAYKVGDKVTIINQAVTGRFMVEGEAIIVKLIDIPDYYLVCFWDHSNCVREQATYERFVNPAAQDDPHGYVFSLNERKNRITK